MDVAARLAPQRAKALPAALARVPYGVVRPMDATAIYADPRAEFRRLATNGVLHRLATGYYAVVPLRAHDREWRPSIEAATYGIAAASYGSDAAVLMGLSAARLHGAIPRALATAVVAVPKQRPALAMADRDATIHFVRRDTDRLDVDRVTTDLGTALVTSVEQTLLDLAHRPDLGRLVAEARDAVRALWSRADPATMKQIADGQRLRAAFGRAQQWAGA